MRLFPSVQTMRYAGLFAASAAFSMLSSLAQQVQATHHLTNSSSSTGAEFNSSSSSSTGFNASSSSTGLAPEHSATTNPNMYLYAAIALISGAAALLYGYVACQNIAKRRSHL